ncbi:GNAT family N-acetyltransferase [Pontixanthobacter aquaemixtae]|uniref:GNAT family N-acetyltransferase n=1 Tax=Pontixanthobacter aquaemixtae TaxID=1958940 RepID=A0A844ZW37_9SPHN|nr:GNAT family protein [Pontixanthobacter aquaemixtae]MXO91390.1 GNAT family N-acetyltransferase [Pontixanthobacter aquaemixtae]
MGDLVLETERLVLRKPQEGDAQLQMLHLNTPAVMEYLGGPKELHEIEAKHAKAEASFAREGFGFMMAIEKASGELVGHCGLKRVDHPLAKNTGDLEVGWLIREDRWRMGYAGEAVCAILDMAFERDLAQHIVALTSERNAPSWRFMEKLGMVRRRDLDFDDPAYEAQDNPTIVYCLTRETWRRRTA